MSAVRTTWSKRGALVGVGAAFVVVSSPSMGHASPPAGATIGSAGSSSLAAPSATASSEEGTGVSGATNAANAPGGGATSSSSTGASPSPTKDNAPVTPRGRAAEPPTFFYPSRFEVDTPRLPAPMSMPELGHPEPNAGIEWITGLAYPNDPTRPASAVGLVRFAFEADVKSLRRTYIGITMPAASALPPDGSGGSKFLLGNLEAHIRVTFPQPTWLAFGATLGVITPTAKFDREGPAQAAALAAISFDPANLAYFQPGAVVLRPAYDVRVIRGPFVAQARQGLDVSLDGAGLRRPATNGRLFLHFGVLARKDLEASIEATQLYLFGTDVPDDQRNAITLGPNIRWTMGEVDLGAGIVTNLFSALSPAVDQIVGLRFSVLGHLK